MDYTLYIDESGDFNTADPKSKSLLIAGVLVQSNRLAAETRINTALDPIFDRYGVRHGLSTMKHLHLKDLREKIANRLKRDGEPNYSYKAIQQSGDVASDLLLSVQQNCTPVHYLSAVNLSDTFVGYATENREFLLEHTYRLMLFDLIALAYSVIPEEQVVSTFHLVIATRTVDRFHALRQIRATEESDVERLLEELRYSIENGLAARGLWTLLSRSALTISTDNAEHNCGLTVADYVANVVANRTKAPSSLLVERLLNAGQLSIFESLGGHEERRARVAERDGDILSALYWHFATKPKTGQDELYDKYSVSLVEKTTTPVSVGSARYILESLIERLWQSVLRTGDLAELYQRLCRAERAYVQVYDTKARIDVDVALVPVLFRLRNFMMSINNRIGNDGEGRRLIEEQKRLQPLLSRNPENFPLLLEAQVFYVETMVNALDVVSARQWAEDHYKWVEKYQALWRGVFASKSDDTAFQTARLFLRAAMTQQRCRILAPTLPENATEEASVGFFIGIFDALTDLTPLCIHVADQGRLRNYQVAALLKAKQFTRAVDIAMVALNDAPTAYDIYWAARASVDAVMAGGTDANIKAKTVLAWLQKHKDTEAIFQLNHPAELIWRDWACLEWLVGDATKANACFAQATRRHNSVVGNSAIHKWHSSLTVLHQAILSGTPFLPSDLFCSNVMCQGLAIKAEPSVPDLKYLARLRRVSPD